MLHEKHLFYCTYNLKEYPIKVNKANCNRNHGKVIARLLVGKQHLHSCKTKHTSWYFEPHEKLSLTGIESFMI